MPGFTLIYKHGGLSESVKDRTKRLVKSSFKIELISKTKELMVLFRDGNHYPYTIIEHDQFIAIIEGRLYEIDATEDKKFNATLQEIYQRGYASPGDFEFIHSLDGEFVIYLLDKKGKKHFVINDCLGRLPLYIYDDRLLIISRDMYILDKVTTGLLYDEESVYQFLRLGYPLGNRTLFQDVRRFPPASVCTLEEGRINCTGQPINLSEIEGSITTIKPEETLYEIFKSALQNRVSNEKKAVLSMSGGLDSRLIMAELVKKKKVVDFATFRYENETIKNDVTVVRQLSKHYQKSPRYFDLREWNPELIEEMAVLKGGMNYVGMSFIIDFLRSLGSDYNLMLTGDGGDKTLPELTPLKHLKNNNIGGYILKTNGINSKKHINSNVIFEIGKYEKRLVELLNDLPGKNAAMKYKHFQVYERARNWLFEGEDRNRNYLWSTAPFYNPEFFKMVHSLPERSKKNYALFRKFTALVDPHLNKVANANWGIELGDENKVTKMLWRQKIKSRLPFKFYPRFQNEEFHEELANSVFELMHKGYGGQVLLNADRYDLNASGTEQLFHLLTLLKVSEMTWKTI